MPLVSQSNSNVEIAPSAMVPYAMPNIAGHGLLVVVFCESSASSPPPLSVVDLAGNAYVPLATASVHSSTGMQDVLEAWYVRSCFGVPVNAVTVRTTTGQSAAFIICVFEYAVGFASLDASAEGTSAGGADLKLSLQVSAPNELVVIAGAVESNSWNFLISVDASTPGFYQEGSGYFEPGAQAPTVPQLYVADLLSSSAGTQAAQIDFANPAGGSCMIAAALPLVGVPASPPGSSGGSGQGSSPGSPVQTPPPPVSIGWQQRELSLGVIPGFFDLSDDCLQAGQPCTDDFLLKISHNAKFAAVRSKLIYMGFYANGNTVPTPVDPDDGYTYSREECQFVCNLFSNRSPAPGFVPGQAGPPAQSNSQPGTLYNWPGAYDVNDATGLVSLRNSYWQNGQEIFSNDGILKVYAVCRRLSINAAN